MLIPEHPGPLKRRDINKHDNRLLKGVPFSRGYAMGLFGLVRRLYSLDTLDTRFTTSSRTPPVATRSKIDPAQPSSTSAVPFENNVRRKDPVESQSSRSPSRWNTPEFFVYYVVIIVVVPMMFKVTYDVSRGRAPFNLSIVFISACCVRFSVSMLADTPLTQNHIQIMAPTPIYLLRGGSRVARLIIQTTNTLRSETMYHTCSSSFQSISYSDACITCCTLPLSLSLLHHLRCTDAERKTLLLL